MTISPGEDFAAGKIKHAQFDRVTPRQLAAEHNLRHPDHPVTWPDDWPAPQLFDALKRCGAWRVRGRV